MEGHILLLCSEDLFSEYARTSNWFVGSGLKTLRTDRHIVWISIYSGVPNRSAGTFFYFDENFPYFSIAQPLFYSVLLMPTRLFEPAFIFGTLE